MGSSKLKIFSYCSATPNGAGKTTTMNILTGLIGHDEGEVKLMNKGVKEVKDIIGYLPEAPKFYNYMTGREYLNFIGELSNYEPVKRKKRTGELLEMVKLKDAGERRIGGYSRGMKQRLALAIALYNHPRLLFLDEPTSALDPEGRREMMELIEELKEGEITVFLSTHILADVERICDRVSILDEGKIVMTKELKELEEEYIQPIFDLEFEKDCQEEGERLKEIEWIDEVKVEGRKMSIYVNNMERAKKDLLSLLVTFNNPALSYNIRKNDLEDIFIRMVNNDE